jgi:multiple antibiotic resistance protein
LTVQLDPVDAFLTLLIGLGPLKALVAYIGLTSGMETAVKRRVATTTVAVAGTVAIVLLIAGSLLQRVLHFSDAALVIAGGMILLLLAVQMVLGQGAKHQEQAAAPPDPTMMAVFPLALPLTLNPVGIVALITYSATTTVGQGIALIGVIAVVLVIDLVVFLSAGRIKSVAPPLISVLEIVLGILLAALAIQLILIGLVDVGIASNLPH